MTLKSCLSCRLLSTSRPHPQASTTVQRGTAFEHRARHILQNNLSMSLRRVGGKSDGGVDLLGWWWIPPLTSDIRAPRRRIRVLAQCKAEKKKIGPNYIRELEGVLYHYLTLGHSIHSLDTPIQDTSLPATVNPPPQPLVALFISESQYTRSTLLRAQSSPVPLFLLHLPPAPVEQDSLPDDDLTGHEWVGSAIWNPALSGGLLGGEAEIRWERNYTGCGRPGLWWRGQKLSNWTPGDDDFGGIEDIPSSSITSNV